MVHGVVVQIGADTLRPARGGYLEASSASLSGASANST